MRFTKLKAGVLLVCMLFVALVSSTAFADSYSPLSVPIGVGGKGTFYLEGKSIDDVKAFLQTNAGLDEAAAAARASDFVSTESVSMSQPVVGYGEFLLTYTEPGNYFYEVYNNDLVQTYRYAVIVCVTNDPTNDTQMQASINVYKMVNGLVGDSDTADKLTGIAIIDPPIKKTVTGENVPTNVTFKFEFKAVGTSVDELKGKVPMPEGVTGQSMELSVVDGGMIETGEIIFDRPGTYVYQFTEKNTGVKGFQYDTSVYKLTVVVAEGPHGFTVTQTITKNDSPISGDAIEFVNQYRPNGNPGEPGGPTKTGDENHVGVYIAATGLFAAAAVAFLVVAMKKKRGLEAE